MSVKENSKFTKKVVKILLKKAFGTTLEIKKDDTDDIWSAECGEFSAACYMNEDNKIVLWITFGGLGDQIIYYNPVTFDTDDEYWQRQLEERDEKSAFAFMLNNNLAVVSAEDADRHGLHQIYSLCDKRKIKETKHF